MNEKQKAKELIEKFYEKIYWSTVAKPIVKKEVAKQCAIICVDEILKVDPLSPSPMTWETTTVETYKDWEQKAYDYWQRVKTEIENY